MKVRIVLPCCPRSNDLAAVPIESPLTKRSLRRQTSNGSSSSSSSSASSNRWFMAFTWGGLVMFLATTFLVMSIDRLGGGTADRLASSTANIYLAQGGGGGINDAEARRRRMLQSVEEGGGEPSTQLEERDDDPILIVEEDEEAGGKSSVATATATTTTSTTTTSENAALLLVLESEGRIGEDASINESGDGNSNEIDHAAGAAVGASDAEGEEADGGEEEPRLPSPGENEMEESESEVLVSPFSGARSNSQDSSSPTAVTAASLLENSPLTAKDLKRIHTCTYGKSETRPTISFATWMWRHRKGATFHDDYVKTPSDAKLKHLRDAIRAANKRDVSRAISLAALAGYTLCKVELARNDVVVVWQNRVRGDALLFTRHGANVPALVVEVPHALFDHTLAQGLHVFSETRAKALLLSSSHRCSKSLANRCTGNAGEPLKTNCAGRSVFHNSDVAHATQNCFHAAHEALALDYPRALFVSLHATNQDVFVVSDGTASPSSSSPALSIAKHLGRNPLISNKVSSCNFQSGGEILSSASSEEAKAEEDAEEEEEEEEVGDDVPEAKISRRRAQRILPAQSSISRGAGGVFPVEQESTHLCGATNVQGRHLNGASSGDACRAQVARNGAPLVPSGRFVHIEQPVALVKPASAKSTTPPMSLPLSEAILGALGLLP